MLLLRCLSVSVKRKKTGVSKIFWMCRVFALPDLKSVFSRFVHDRLFIYNIFHLVSRSLEVIVRSIVPVLTSFKHCTCILLPQKYQYFSKLGLPYISLSTIFKVSRWLCQLVIISMLWKLKTLYLCQLEIVFKQRETLSWTTLVLVLCFLFVSSHKSIWYWDIKFNSVAEQRCFLFSLGRRNAMFHLEAEGSSLHQYDNTFLAFIFWVSEFPCSRTGNSLLHCCPGLRRAPGCQIIAAAVALAVMLFGLIKALISLTGRFGMRSADTHCFSIHCVDLGTYPTCPFAACRARSYQDAFEVPQEGDKRPWQRQSLQDVLVIVNRGPDMNIATEHFNEGKSLDLDSWM